MKKKFFTTPTLTVYAVKRNDIIATSSEAPMQLGDLTEDSDTWDN